MEEIITVDGRQFKLTTDRPLTIEQKAQTIAEIRKSAGCGTCGQPRVLGPSDWQYGGVYGMVPTSTQSTATGVTGKGSGDDITLKVTPTGGVGPYKAWFYIHHTSADRGATISTARLGTGSSGSNPPGKTLLGGGLANPQTSITEGATTTAVYILDDTDVRTATGDGTATRPIDVDGTSGALSFGTVAATLSAAAIRFYTAVVDSCTGTTGPAACIQWADVSLVCISPTCNFVVT